jgi:hypothetical protein
MQARFTGLWVTLALAMLGFILLVERRWTEPPRGPRVLLTGWDPAQAVAVEVRRPRELPLRVVREGGRWWLETPLRDPADDRRVEALLAALVREPVQTVLTTSELLQRPDALAEYGLESPRVTLRVQAPNRMVQIQFGDRTAPGDQVFVQVVGEEELWVVSAEVLRLLPAQPADWRERRWVRVDSGSFDRLTVSNRLGWFALGRDPEGDRWRLEAPLRARVDPDRVQMLWQGLQGLEVLEFVADDPEADAEVYGFAPPVLALGLWRGTSAVAQFEFGRSPTNHPDRVYARQAGRAAVVTVPAEPVGGWLAGYADFRDRRLLRWEGQVSAVEFLGGENFAVHRLPVGWRILPWDLPADEALVEGLLDWLRRLEVVEFVKDVVIEPDLARYGLAPPTRQVVLRRAARGAGDTNTVLGEIQLGLVQDDKVFVRRWDEPTVYAVRASDLAGLPTAFYQLRDRRIWRIPEGEVERVIVEEGSRRREMIRHDAYAWTLAPGSQGIINSLAVGEAVRTLCELDAVAWLGVGEARAAEYGFERGAWSVTLRRRDGETLTVSFARPRQELPLLGMVRLEGQPWVFVTSPVVQELVQAYLKLPPDSGS